MLFVRTKLPRASAKTEDSRMRMLIIVVSANFAEQPKTYDKHDWCWNIPDEQRNGYAKW